MTSKKPYDPQALRVTATTLRTYGPTLQAISQRPRQLFHLFPEVTPLVYTLALEQLHPKITIAEASRATIKPLRRLTSILENPAETDELSRVWAVHTLWDLQRRRISPEKYYSALLAA